ncbi:MAG: type II toxin-antitoxin system RelE/ParE family toxin [Bacteroidetes bacterium]|nr:type II toxin-antitoxin system RelE/ParE family toxin [Bacteroidota bacterium]
MEYNLIIKPSAKRDLNSLPDKEVEQIVRRIVQLINNPRPFGIQKLTDEEGYRIRIGKYRVLFEIDDKKKNILIFRIKHRKEVYR